MHMGNLAISLHTLNYGNRTVQWNGVQNPFISSYKERGFPWILKMKPIVRRTQVTAWCVVSFYNRSIFRTTWAWIF